MNHRVSINSAYNDHTGLFGFKYNGTSYLYRKDLQGNIVAILDSNGYVVYRYEYDAWGNYNVYDEDGTKVSYSGRTYPGGRKNPTKLCDINPFTYRGYFHDCETGLYYLQSRYYDPDTGMFVSADDVSYIDPMERSGLNLYAYCNNNPIMYTDPTGTFVLSSFLIGMGIAALVGAGVSAVAYTASEAVSWAITGEWDWSWGMFAGSTLGGAIGGALSFALPGLGLEYSAVFTTTVSTAIGMVFQNLWEGANHGVADILCESLISGVISGATAHITSLIKIPGFTGRGSITQVAKQINTKFFNGTIRKISIRTLQKITAYEAAYNIFDVLVDISKNIYQYYRIHRRWSE